MMLIIFLPAVRFIILEKSSLIPVPKPDMESLTEIITVVSGEVLPETTIFLSKLRVLSSGVETVRLKLIGSWVTGLYSLDAFLRVSKLTK